MKDNLILMTDSYKLTHWLQYPKGTTKVYSYMESRGGLYPSTLFFGLRYPLQRYLTQVVTMEMVNEAEEFTNIHIGKGVFNRAGWEHVVNEHGGKLPLKIMAVKEGSLVPNSNVLMTIENTDPECYWLTNYVETLLMKVWAPITIATNSHYAKQTLLKYAKITGSDISGVDFQLHDFGYRGVSSEESAAILDAAHLVSFKGSDTIAGMRLIQQYYDWNVANGLPAYSVPASEHSTATPYGRNEGEKNYILNMLDKYPIGIVSAIADSYDVYGMAKLISTDEEIKTKILNRDGVFVLRLDSGEPSEVILRVLDILWENIGGKYTDKSYRILNPKIRILQGDGIDNEAIDKILTVMGNNKYASGNIVFGSGGGLLQKFNRDTQSFAIKCSFCEINGQPVNVQKDPVTGSSKKSKQGKLKLHQTGGAYMTISSTDSNFDSYIDSLEVVYENGVLYNTQNFEQIRQRVLSNK